MQIPAKTTKICLRCNLLLKHEGFSEATVISENVDFQENKDFISKNITRFTSFKAKSWPVRWSRQPNTAGSIHYMHGTGEHGPDLKTHSQKIGTQCVHMSGDACETIDIAS